MSAWLAWLAGLMMIMHMSLPAWLRALLALVWSIDVGWSLAGRSAGLRDLRRLRITADGRVSAQSAAGHWVRLRLRPGSIVTARFAWLRLARDGGSAGVLFSRATSGSEAWRRLRLIWRWGGPGND